MSLPFTSLFIKYLLFIFNLIFVLSGIILLVVGSVIQAAYIDYDPVLNESFFSVPVLLIVIGAIIFVVSFFGCCGAYKENYCLTISFCVSLILIFILELSGGIAGYLLRDRVSDIMGNQLQWSMKKYNISGSMDNNTINHQIHVMWDEMQTNFHCCGDNSTTSWLEVMNSLPPSCCPNNMAPCDVAFAYKESCRNVLIDYLKSNAGILGGVGVGIAIIQLLGIIFACNLASSIRDYESV